MKTITLQLYTFDELSGEVQKELRKTGNEIRKGNYVTKINCSPKII